MTAVAMARPKSRPATTAEQTRASTTATMAGAATTPECRSGESRSAPAQCNRCEALRRSATGGSEDDREEHERQHQLGSQTGQERIATRRMARVPVRRESCLDVEPRLAAGDQQQDG